MALGAGAHEPPCGRTSGRTGTHERLAGGEALVLEGGDRVALSLRDLGECEPVADGPRRARGGVHRPAVGGTPDEDAGVLASVREVGVEVVASSVGEGRPAARVARETLDLDDLVDAQVAQVHGSLPRRDAGTIRR